MKDVNVYYSSESWKKLKPDVVLKGEIICRDGSVGIRTFEGSCSYVQTLSNMFVFAITEEMPYGFTYDEKDCYLYLGVNAWEKEKPDFEFTGVISKEETGGEYFSVIAEGYKQYISKNKVFAIAYQE